MTKFLINFTRKIICLLWLKMSSYIYSGIVITVNVNKRYGKSSFMIRRLQRYCLLNLAPFRFSLYMLIPVSCYLCYILDRLQKQVKTKAR